MASCSKKMKLMNEDDQENQDEEITMELKHEKTKLKLLNLQEMKKDQAKVDIKIESPKKEKKDDIEMDIKIESPKKEKKDDIEMDIKIESPKKEKKDDIEMDIKIESPKKEKKDDVEMYIKIESPKKEKKDDVEMVFQLTKPEPKDKAQFDLDAICSGSGKKYIKTVTSKLNTNKPEAQDKKRSLELIPWKPFPLADFLKLPVEEAPIEEEGPDFSGGNPDEESEEEEE